MLDSRLAEPNMYKHNRKFRYMRKQCKWYRVCPIRYFTDEGVIEKKWSEKYCFDNWESCKRYNMEENNEFHPDIMLPDGSVRESLLKFI